MVNNDYDIQNFKFRSSLVTGCEPNCVFPKGYDPRNIYGEVSDWAGFDVVELYSSEKECVRLCKSDVMALALYFEIISEKECTQSVLKRFPKGEQ